MRQQRARYAAVLVMLAAAILGGNAQQLPPQRADRPLIEGVTAVLVDVVVRDRRGQPVRDLALSDFEIVEDGVPQTVGSFTAVMSGGAAPATGNPPAAAVGAALVAC